MAAKTNKTAVKKDSAGTVKKTAPAENAAAQPMTAAESITTEKVGATAAPDSVPVRDEPHEKRKVSRDDTVTVRSGCPNRLVYASPRSGYVTVWENYGDEQVLLVDDLLDAKRIAPSYFQKNYFLIDDRDVLGFIGAEKFYENPVTPEVFDQIFAKDPEDIPSIVRVMNDGQREILTVRTRNMIREGRLTDLRRIRALAAALGVEFPVD